MSLKSLQEELGPSYYGCMGIAAASVLGASAVLLGDTTSLDMYVMLESVGFPGHKFQEMDPLMRCVTLASMTVYPAFWTGTILGTIKTIYEHPSQKMDDLELR
jgi:hypothetical protein